MNREQQIQDYLAGPEQLRQAIQGMTADEFDATPVPGKWSTRQVICHISDFEPVYADRMKRVIVEEKPSLPGGDQDLYALKLAYQRRDIDEELQLITAVRQSMGRILNTLNENQFLRTGLHSHDGEVTIADLLERVTHHIPHHIQMIQEKREALSA